MTDLTPALPADLFGDVESIEALTDAEFRLLCSKLLSAVKSRDAETASVVGRMLVFANARYPKSDYETFVEDVGKAIDRSGSTLWRWRREAEKTMGVPQEAPSRGVRRLAPPRVHQPAIEANSPLAISEISAGEGAGSAAAVAPPAEPPSGPTAAVPSPAPAADKADESGVEPEVPRSSGSAVKSFAQLVKERVDSVLDDVLGPKEVDGAAATREGAEPGMPTAAGKIVRPAPSTPSLQGQIRGGLPGQVPGSAGSTPASGDDRAQAPVAVQSGQVAHGAAGEPQTTNRVHETRGLTGLSLPVNPTDRQLDEVQEWFEGLLVRRSMEQIEHLRVACINAKLAQLQYRGNGSLKRDQVQPSFKGGGK